MNLVHESRGLSLSRSGRDLWDIFLPIIIMKFCKNLQNVILLADPAWSPYWLNYKLLKKKLKSLPTFGDSSRAADDDCVDSETSSVGEEDLANGRKGQHGGDTPVERASVKRTREAMEQQPPLHAGSSPHPLRGLAATNPATSNNGTMGGPAPLLQSPEEVDFFKALHAELKKAEFFFKEATREHKIRLHRITRGVIVVKAQSRSMVDDTWGTMARAMYSLYKDLLLLETFAIMTYVGFSKILKKHDKVTGFRTCSQYMSNVVGTANFTHYPEVMSMISCSQRLYEEISEALEHEGKQALSEDEHLFINMIQKVNMEAKSVDDGTPASPSESGAPDYRAVGDLRELLEGDSAENGDDGGGGGDDVESKHLAKKPTR